MLAGLLYNDILPFFKHHNEGLFPDDVLEILEDLGISCRAVNKLPKRQPALVAIEWLETDLSGHYVVWDPSRNQFLDPLFGLIEKKEFLGLCKVEHIWTTGRSNMKELVKARVAKAAAKELFEPFGPAAVGLGRGDEGFTIEVRFYENPPEEAFKITEVKGFVVKIQVVGKIKEQK